MKVRQEESSRLTCDSVIHQNMENMHSSRPWFAKIQDEYRPNFTVNITLTCKSET